MPIRRLDDTHNPPIRDIQEDSRRVRAACLFVARRGEATDGLAHAPAAIAAGAAAILTDRPYQIPPDLNQIPVLQTDQLPDAAGTIAQRLLGQPAEKLNVIGITGTNGKTTTAYLLRHLLNTIGQTAGMIGTIEIDTGHSQTPAQLTTPGLIDTHHLLAQMVAQHCAACIMEVSSHALQQNRVAAILFAAAIFTNLTGDHLDYHKTTEAYAAAKAKLFDQLDPQSGQPIVNADDPWHQTMLDGRTFPATPKRFAITAADVGSADTRAVIDHIDAHRTRIQLTSTTGAVTVESPLIGKHNVYNLLAAVAAAERFGLDLSDPHLPDIIAQLPGTPGRLERVIGDDAAPPFTVLVDYAHTDDALRNVLTALRPLCPAQLRVLFGCGGDRDATKRPRMAAVACELADRIVITSDNPRTEDPTQIINDILTGVPADARSRAAVVPDRAHAIQQIVHDAQPHDIVLLAGKGHEDYQILGTQRIDFDDRLHARAALHALNQTPARADS